MIEVYSLREKGFLPYPGAYGQQPAKLVHGLQILDNALAEADRLRDKKRKAQEAARGSSR